MKKTDEDIWFCELLEQVQETIEDQRFLDKTIDKVYYEEDLSQKTRKNLTRFWVLLILGALVGVMLPYILTWIIEAPNWSKLSSIWNWIGVLLSGGIVFLFSQILGENPQTYRKS